MFEENLNSSEMAKVLDMPIEEVEKILLNNQLIPEQLKTYALTHQCHIPLGKNKFFR